MASQPSNEVQTYCTIFCQIFKKWMVLGPWKMIAFSITMTSVFLNLTLSSRLFLYH